MYINKQQSNWVSQLLITQIAYNNIDSIATKQSPFYINYGYHLEIGHLLSNEGISLNAEDYTKKLQSLYQIFRDKL